MDVSLKSETFSNTKEIASEEEGNENNSPMNSVSLSEKSERRKA